MSDDYSDEAAIDEEAMLAAAEASPALLAENKRLRASHDELLAAAKDVVAYYSPSRDVPFGYDQGVLDVLRTAIVAVEKLARYD